MKRILVLACALLICALGLAQSQTPSPQNPNDLPSAPSATLAPKPAPKPAPPTAPPVQPPATSDHPAASDSTRPTAPAATPAASVPAASTPANGGSAEAAKPADLPKSAREDQPGTTISIKVNEVNVIFTVTDKHGRFVKDLKKEDINVLDDRKPPQALVNFRAETDLPLRVGLLIDASSSVRSRFQFEQQAAIEFLNQIVRPKSDQAFVLSFDATPTVEQDFTDSSELLSRGVRAVRPGGGTAFYDALYFACRDKLAKVDAGKAVRRAIVVVTDGDDNQSRVTREEAIEMAQRAEVIIYAVSTNDSGSRQAADKVLERIAEATGGRAFFPFKIDDIANYFTEIQDELRSQYAVAYRPADFQMDGRYRSIEILAQKKNLRVRARKGYYAPRQ